MYELIDLQGLILSLIYKELDKNDKAGYLLIKDQVEEEIIRYTSYTVTMIGDAKYLSIKNQLLRPFAWILEYYALALNPSLSDLQVNRIHTNYKEAKEMLETFPRFYEDDTEGSIVSGNYPVKGVVEW